MRTRQYASGSHDMPYTIGETGLAPLVQFEMLLFSTGIWKPELVESISFVWGDVRIFKIVCPTLMHE